LMFHLHFNREVDFPYLGFAINHAKRQAMHSLDSELK
jgi:hypothetical protein